MPAVRILKAHVAINVRNVEESAQFYRKLFGIEPSKVRTGYAKFDVQNPPLNFTLNQIPFADAGALSHMGLQVDSTADVLAIRQQWAEAGPLEAAALTGANRLKVIRYALLPDVLPNLTSITLYV